MDIQKLYGILLPYFRRRRMEQFLKEFHPGPTTRILDVGGGPLNWNLIKCKSRITLLNLKFWGNESSAFTLVRGDTNRLPYLDQTFDIAFSNSVIEHLQTYERQQKFAEEVRRVGRNLWIQTPAREFFIEPHLITPFMHYLPKKWQRRLIRNFSVWGLLTRPDQASVENFVNQIRLPTCQDMLNLFPNCEIRKERFLGLVKAYIAIRKIESYH